MALSYQPLTAKMICVFVFACADCWFFHETADIEVRRDLNLANVKYCWANNDIKVLVHFLGN